MLSRLGSGSCCGGHGGNSTSSNSRSNSSTATSNLNAATALHPSHPRNLQPRSHSGQSVNAVASSQRLAPLADKQLRKSTQDEAAAARRASVKLPQLLTNQISAATSLPQLHDVIASHGNRLNHFHVAKLLTRTSQLAAAAAADHQSVQQPVPTEQQQPQRQHVQLLHVRLTQMMAQRARHSIPDTLVAAVAAAGRLTALLHAHTDSSSSSSSSGVGVLTKQPQWQQQLQLLADRAIELQDQFNISQLSASLWGFAKAGFSPSRKTLDALLNVTMQAYNTAYQQQQQTQQQQQQQTQQQPAAGVSAQQQLLPKPVRPALQQQHQQRRQTVFLHQKGRESLPHQHSLATDLALVMYATAAMGQQPQQQWLQQWQAAVLQQLQQANPQDLSQMLWGLGVLRQNPGGQQWLEKVLLHFADKLEGCGSQALANSIWAVQRLTQQQQQPQQQASAAATSPLVLPAAWKTAFLEALYTEPSLPSSPQALSCCLASLARLRISPEPSRVVTLLDAAVDSLPACTPRQLTDLLWACASLNLQPSPAWLKAYLTTAARAADAGRFNVQQLGTLVWSLAVVKPPSQALLVSQQLQVQVLLQAVAKAQQGQGLRMLGPAGRSGLAWALASLGVPPERSWLGQFLAAAFADGLASDQVRCASLLFCIASLDFEYLVDWLGDFLEGKHGDLNGQGESNWQGESNGLDLSLQKYAALVGVLGALADLDSKQLRAAWLDQTLTPEWSAEAANEGLLGSSMQLPPALATWVDTLAEHTSALAAEPAEVPAAGAAAAAAGAPA